MAASKTEICNLALAHLGQQKGIDDFDNDRGAPARACRLFYDETLRATFRDFAWPFATKFAELALVTTLEVDDTHPSTEWKYAYRYPADAVSFRRIPSGTRNDTRQTKVPYRLYEDVAGTLLLTDMEDAVGEYTFLREDVERYPSDFVLALSRRLAAYIAPTVTAGDPFKLQDKNFKLYLMELQAAQGTAGNEEQAEELPDSEHLNARNS